MIEYRKALLEEFPLSVELRRAMGIEMGSNYDFRRQDWGAKYCEYFGGIQSEGRAQLFLAFNDNRAIGMAIISLRDEWRSYCFGTRFGFVNAVYVEPEYRRRGIARELMNRVIAWARERGCVLVRLRTSDEGRSLYQSVGFKTGREMELDL